jgi:hypothetical protein
MFGDKVRAEASENRESTTPLGPVIAGPFAYPEKEHSMSTPFPAFAKSNHPDVLESIHETHRRAKEFHQKMGDAAENIVGERNGIFYRGFMFDGQSFSGFSYQAVKAADVPGQWKKPEGGVTRPYKNNPIWDELKGLTFEAAKIPGRTNLMWGIGRMGTGTLFDHDGYVYSGINFPLDTMSEREAAEAEEFGWTEIMASEFHKAMETVNALRAAERGES